MVVGERVREVRELPRELEVRGTTRTAATGTRGSRAGSGRRSPSQAIPGASSRYGSEPADDDGRTCPCVARPTGPGPPARSDRSRGSRPCSGRSGASARASRRSGRRASFAAASGLSFERLVLDALDRRDVVRAEGDLRSDLRVVDGVHVRRRGRHAAPERDEHVVRPDDPALLGNRPFDLRLSSTSWTSRRTTPRTPRSRLGERRRVVVARELADLARVQGRLDARRSPRSNVSSVTLAGSSPFSSMTRPTVSAIELQDLTFPLSFGSSKSCVDARDRPR